MANPKVKGINLQEKTLNVKGVNMVVSKPFALKGINFQVFLINYIYNGTLYTGNLK